MKLAIFGAGGVGGYFGGRPAAAGTDVTFITRGAHLLAATPMQHWLEYVVWAVPILQEPLQIIEGMAVLPDRPGNGMRWNAAAVARFQLD